METALFDITKLVHLAKIEENLLHIGADLQILQDEDLVCVRFHGRISFEEVEKFGRENNLDLVTEEEASPLVHEKNKDLFHVCGWTSRGVFSSRIVPTIKRDDGRGGYVVGSFLLLSGGYGYVFSESIWVGCYGLPKYDWFIYRLPRLSS